MTYYRYHVFFCTNERDSNDRPSCGRCGSASMRDYLKRRVKELGLAGKGGVRINTAGCMNRCEEGPVIVIYPESIWYTCVDEEDLEEILQEHLLKGTVVERLRLPD